MVRLGLTQSPSLLGRLASPSGNSAALVFRVAPPGRTEIARLRRRSTSNPFLPPPFQICLRRAAREMAQAQSVIHMRLGCRQAGGREE